jgi:hypothetical protein
MLMVPLLVVNFMVPSSSEQVPLVVLCRPCNALLKGTVQLSKTTSVKITGQVTLTARAS